MATRSAAYASRHVAKKARRLKSKNEFEATALLLQGGGALGPYQAGVYEALSEAGILPDWVGGISIGAINGAIIAGNKPAERIKKLHDFWMSLTAKPYLGKSDYLDPFIQQGGDAARTFWDKINAGISMTAGVPGFFKPHALPWLFPEGSPSATSFYDTAPFKETLEEFVDFKILNSGEVRYTISAVNVCSGNYTVFENLSQTIGPEHVMASSALPPALPPIKIEGQYFWDGGLISNTPLQWVMNDATKDTLVFQVDLWCAEGEMPKDMLEVMTRQKEIQYSSRTRAMTDRFKESQKLRHAFATLYKKLPENLKNSTEAKMMRDYVDFSVYNIVHLIYRTRQYEGYSKDYEFSRLSMEEHWKAGYNDTLRSLRNKAIFKLPTCPEGIVTYDETRN